VPYKCPPSSGGLPAGPDLLNGRRGNSSEKRFSVSGFQFSVKKNATWHLVATYTCWCFIYGLYVDMVRAFCFYRKPKTPKKRVPSLWMELPLPSGVTELTKKPSGRSSGSRISRRRSAFPPGVFYQAPAVAGRCPNLLRPRLQRRDRPGFAPGSGLPGVWYLHQ
jgi:hypothetical protein